MGAVSCWDGVEVGFAREVSVAVFRDVHGHGADREGADLEAIARKEH